VTAIELDALTWPQVRAEIEAGRDAVVVALGATEQHGHHLPLATDALLGDHLARALADRLDAFLAPTLRVGCSAHHLGFAGTMSLSEDTFQAVVCDLVRSLSREASAGSCSCPATAETSPRSPAPSPNSIGPSVSRR
jgi:creatinine amidohydrolase